MLDFDVHSPEPGGHGSRLIVLLHGRGSDKDDMIRLAPHLSPAAVVAPRAPFDAAPWGYGPGWAWYRFLGRDRPEPESFSASLREIDHFLRQIPDRIGFRAGEVLLGGFSQGGTMSLAYALHRPGTVDGVINFSGFLADHPEVRAEEETASGLRVFWGHGVSDPNIPFDLAIEGRQRLARAGADLTTGDYPIGHWISPDELDDLRRWIGDDLAP